MVESTSGHETIQTFAASDQLVRPARCLIGWLPEEIALRALNGSRADVEPSVEQRAAVQVAHASVANRAAGVDQTDIVGHAPTGVLDEHVAKLTSLPATAPYLAEGFEVALVDLSRLCGFQPTIFTDSARERVAGTEPNDLAAIASVTLPTEWQTEQQAQFDETRNTWLMVSRNPNLKVLGHFAAAVGDPAVQGFGFAVSVTPSFMQAARYQGRYFLRDGYHRAFGLLAMGVTWAPVFLRDFDSIQQLVPPGMLPQEAFLGERPPTLRDYADTEVSAEIQVPASQKVVVVQALELSPRG
jgi:hypothetical protein